MRLGRPRRVTVHGRTYRIDRRVFNPVTHLSGVAMAHHLPQFVDAGSSVLDVGTGCGILAGTAANTAGSVVATDINPHAVRNAQANLVGRPVDVREGDLFAPVGTERFDLIVCNPPYLIEESGDSALASPDFLRRFGAAAPDHADRVVLGYPAEDAANLSLCGLPFTLACRIPTRGRDLGIFIASV